jgi:hypothetical protein
LHGVFPSVREQGGPRSLEAFYLAGPQKSQEAWKKNSEQGGKLVIGWEIRILTQV